MLQRHLTYLTPHNQRPETVINVHFTFVHGTSLSLVDHPHPTLTIFDIIVLEKSAGSKSGVYAGSLTLNPKP